MLGLQKTGLRLKRLISHRRHSSLDSSGNSLEDLRFADTQLSTNSTKRLSSLSQSPTLDIAPLRRANSHATVRKYHLPTANTTPHSSATSLCSCDCAANQASKDVSLSREEQSSDQPEILYLPPLSPRNDCGDAQIWRLIFQETPSQSQSPASTPPRRLRRGRPTAIIAPGSTFDLIGALAMESTDNESTSTHSLQYANESDTDDFSDNVEQLIRETDLAFQAVGNALAEARAATQGWYDTETPVPRSSPIPRGILKKNQSNPRSAVLSLRSSSLPLRSMSVAKKKKPLRRNLLNRALRSAPAPPTNTPSRWTLNDVTTNMVDIFSGKIFRTEVDEMLTPGRLEQLQHSIRLSNEPRESADSARSNGTDEDTPTEPFHLQSLSNRIDASQMNPPLPRPNLPPPPIPELRRQAPTRPPRPEKVHFTDQRLEAGTSEGMTISSLTFPFPPRPPLPRRSSASSTIHLPTIPEIFPVAIPPNSVTPGSTLPPPSPLSSPQQSLQESDFITLPSTPTTLTSPLFQHGPIRVPLPLPLVSSRFPHHSNEDEETLKLDWTAFQIAICGTDSYYDEREQQELFEWEETEILVDELVQWWADIGFVDANWGRMVWDASLNPMDSLVEVRSENNVGMLKKKRERISEVERVAPPDPNAYLLHSGTAAEVLDTAKILVDSSYSPYTEASILTSWETEMSDVQEAEIDWDRESLPPSPMLDLATRSGKQDDIEVIPMGFNLGHDLGDFLKWEVENVQMFVDR